MREDVLVVRERTALVQITAALLRISGYFVEEACSFTAARELCQKYEFRLIVFDASIGSDCGFRFYREVRDQSGATGISIGTAESAGTAGDITPAGSCAHLHSAACIGRVLRTVRQVLQPPPLSIAA